jgi:hypothetical protein
MLSQLRSLVEAHRLSPSFDGLLEILKECARYGLPFSMVDQDFRELEHECRMERIARALNEILGYCRVFVNGVEYTVGDDYVETESMYFSADPNGTPLTLNRITDFFASPDHVHGSPPYMVSDQVFQDWRAMVTGQVVHSPAPEEEADDEQT